MPMLETSPENNLAELFIDTKDIFPASPKILVGEDRLNYEKISKYYKDFCETVTALVEKIKELGPTKSKEQMAEIKEIFEKEIKKFEAQKEKLNSKTSPVISKIFETVKSVVQGAWEALKLIVAIAVEIPNKVAQIGSGVLKIGGGVVALGGGALELSSAAVELSSGVAQFGSGVAQFDSKVVGSGVEQLSSGVAQFSSGATQFGTGVVKIGSGVTDILIVVGDVAKNIKKVGEQISELLTGPQQKVALGR